MKKIIVALLSAAGIALGSASAADSSNAAKGEKEEAVTEALGRQRVEDWANTSKDCTRIGAMNPSETASTALRAPSPPLGEKDGMRGNGSWKSMPRSGIPMETASAMLL